MSRQMSARAEQIDLERQRVHVVLLIALALRRRVGNDAAIPMEVRADLDHRQRRRQGARRHHVLGADFFVGVVEIDEVAGLHVDRADGETQPALVDEREVDEFAEGLGERRGVVVAGRGLGARQVHPRTDLVHEHWPEPLDRPLVYYEWISMPESSGFGGYTETGLAIGCRCKGEETTFVSQMYLDDDRPIAAGRVVSSFAKKYAHRKRAAVRATGGLSNARQFLSINPSTALRRPRLGCLARVSPCRRSAAERAGLLRRAARRLRARPERRRRRP